MACPQCSSQDDPRPIGFTWWGGLIGAKILSHAECLQCGTRYNSKTGKSNNTAIAIYMIVVGIIAAMVVYAINSGGGHSRY